MAKRNERQRIDATMEVIVANNHRVREEASAIDIAITIGGTGGQNGVVLGDHGSSNPHAAMAIVYRWLAQMEAKHGPIDGVAAEADDDED